MLKINSFSPAQRYLLNGLISIISLIFCALLLPTRLPGTTLLGLGPHWWLIWVVAWSVKSQPWRGTMAGVAAGLIKMG